ncbi:MAG TPA: MgtC/SapB family protein, partial [Solirubrobacterales bacterium]
MTSEWDLIWRLALALALSAAIGLEREQRQKAAGLRTYTLVGLGSALFMLISKYGFFDVLEPKTVVLDPSR